MTVNFFGDKNLFSKILISAEFIEDGGEVGKLEVFLLEGIHSGLVSSVEIVDFMTLIIIEFR